MIPNFRIQSILGLGVLAGLLWLGNLSTVSAAPGLSSGPAKTVTRVSTLSGDNGQTVILEANGAIEFTAFKLTNPPRLVLDLAQMAPGTFQKPLSVNRGGVKDIRPLHFDQAGILRMEIGLQGRVNYDILHLQPHQLQIRISPAPGAAETISSASAGKTSIQKPAPTLAQVSAPAPAPAPAPEPAKAPEENKNTDPDSCAGILSGPKQNISFDFQQANVRNILRILSETGKFNLVISPEVQGTVTMRLDNIPWDRALNLVLQNNRLGRQCQDDVMRVATQTVFIQQETERQQIRSPQAASQTAEKNAQDLVTEVVRINYGILKDIVAALTPLRTTRGAIVQDSRTNSLVITDIRPTLDAMLKLVQKLDTLPPQVMIEARIVEVNKNATQELGIQWGGTITRTTGNEFPNSIRVGAASQSATGFVVDVPASGAPTGSLGMSLGSLIGDTTLDIQLQALERQGRAKVLSSPKVTTLDNRQARINSGRRIPFQTVSQNGTVTQFAEAAITLQVTPHITSDQKIHMQILAQKNAADFSNSVNGVPSIRTKEASTEVLVKDGDTTVLGGLYESTISENVNKVPVFSDVPILGWLFRRAQDIDTIDELLIFITPVLVQTLEKFRP